MRSWLQSARRLHAGSTTVLSYDYKAKRVVAAASPSRYPQGRNVPPLEVFEAPGQYAYSFDRSSMALDAAVQGLGIACDSASIAAGHLRDGRLRKVFDERWCVKVQAHTALADIHESIDELAYYRAHWLV